LIEKLKKKKVKEEVESNEDFVIKARSGGQGKKRIVKQKVKTVIKGTFGKYM
jgi:hypothetical protein